MSRSKTPVLIVGAALVALILLPLLIWLLSGRGGGPGVPVTVEEDVRAAAGGSTVDFDIRQLADRASSLLENEIAAGVQEGKITLDFVAGLTREMEKGNSDLAAGRTVRAGDRFRSVIAAAEARLEALALADKARALNETTYAELERLEYLKGGFENTYREAVETYNDGLRALGEGEYKEALDGFEMTGAILSDLEARALQQIAGLLESAETALADYRLDAARTAYEEALRIDPANPAATEGLSLLAAMEGIAHEVKEVRTLEEAGDLEGALERLNALAAANPTNPFVRKQQEIITAKILDRDIAALVAAADAAEAKSDYAAAIEAIEKAIALRPSPELAQRLAELQETYKAVRLEALLAAGYDALTTGRYGEARDRYKEAVDLDPKSKEAGTGYEKASSLYLASIRYNQGLATAEKYIEEGRFPLAAKFFNEAMAAKPNNLPATLQAREDRLRSSIEAQGNEVSVTVVSDKRTYVSIIRVLPPERFKEKQLSLFPDVYIVKGTRKDYKPVEIELRVDATKPNQQVEVICREKQ